MKGFTVDTQRVRRVHLGLFLKWCGENGATAPIQITSALLERYQQHLFFHRKKRGQPLADSTQYARLTHLRAWCQWMARQNHIQADPATALELPRIGYRLPSVLNRDDAELVLKQPNLQGN